MKHGFVTFRVAYVWGYWSLRRWCAPLRDHKSESCYLRFVGCRRKFVLFLPLSGEASSLEKYRNVLAVSAGTFDLGAFAEPVKLLYTAF